MTTIDAAEGNMLTLDEALGVVRLHRVDEAEFFADVGERDEYEAVQVFEWLGY